MEAKDRFWTTVVPVGICLFCSGFCALIYQTVWLREFRLIFGASTAASAAVLAIFMGGLGAGALVLGRKAGAVSEPFRWYSKLEFAVALSAAVTPALLKLACWTYIALGGTPLLGQFWGTVLRLCLAIVVLLVPTFLMGATLPAAVQAAQSDGDARRRQMAFVYSANTFGAVCGALFSTFYLVEHLGNHLTLWLGCAVNVLVAVASFYLSARLSPNCQSHDGGVPSEAGARSSTLAATLRLLVVLGAAGAGFAFFLMEMVWYRMLTPLLGGSTYSFGLILAVALSGIAAGSLAFALMGAGQPVTLAGFAGVSALEALFVALPLALGDRVALLAILLQPFVGLGFAGRIACWTIIASIVIFPGAVLAGAQFPMLIALLGRGREKAGTHTAQAYTWNTAGAIAGSLAGGFGLLPALGALGVWRLAVIVLLAMAVGAGWLRLRATNLPKLRDFGGEGETTSDLERNSNHLLSFRSRVISLVPAGLAGALALAMLAAPGPTAVWRHTPIGAGRVTVKETKRSSLNALQDFVQTRRRNLIWEVDGIESSIGLMKEDGLSFIVNGKSDGSARGDAPTQVMLGLLGALIHPDPREALVIGLGTGSTAGWLAAVPSIERVHVVELEPAMRRVAEDCALVNHGALANPKLHLWVGDGREVLLADRQQYDVIASEPSNPYRAGVASLFTREFYLAVAKRLRTDGLFVQWVQAYEVDGESIRTVLATLRSVFSTVETWKTQNGDLCFVAAAHPFSYDLARMRERVGQEPFRSAVAYVWRVTDLEGVFGRYVAHHRLADGLAAAEGRVNSDDRNYLEFGFARTVGAAEGFDIDILTKLAFETHWDRPNVSNGALDWQKVCDRRVSALASDGRWNFEGNSEDQGFRARTQAKAAYAHRDFGAALAAWRAQSQEPTDLLELILVAESLATLGNDSARAYISRLRPWSPSEADAIEAKLLWRQRRAGEAFASANKALRALHDDPWPRSSVLESALEIAQTICKENKGQSFAGELSETLRQPFAVRILDVERILGRVEAAQVQDPLGLTNLTKEAVAEFEPHVPWTAEFLRLRWETYVRRQDDRALAALADLQEFESREALAFVPWTSEELANFAKRSHAAMASGALPVQAREK